MSQIIGLIYLSFLLFLNQANCGMLPCNLHSVGTCSEVVVGNIVGNNPFTSLSASDCQTACNLIYGTECTLFIFDRANLVCTLHDGDLTAYLESCKDASGPYREELDSCVPDILNHDPSCYEYRESNCVHSGTVLAEVGAIPDASTCELFCELSVGSGCRYFVFSAIANFCQLYASDYYKSCGTSIGPVGPSYQLCSFVD